MLGRHIVSYLPSQVIPGLMSLISITVLTHLLSPADYGRYSLIINGHFLVNGVFFGWLHNFIARVGSSAQRDGKSPQLIATMVWVFMRIILGLMIVIALYSLWSQNQSYSQMLWFMVGMGSVRALMNMHLFWHRSVLNIKRFNLLDCGQSVIGTVIGIALVCFTQYGAVSVITGLMVGTVVMLWLDRRFYTHLRQNDICRATLHDALHLGLPLVVSYLFTFTLAYADRFLIEAYQGASVLGVYAAGYALIDRVMQLLFMVVATASYALTAHRLDHEGMEAAREQTYRNGIGMLALTMPAMAGLICCTPQIAAVFIGEEFRAGAQQIMPIIALSSFLNGLTVHYFDHAFLLARKTRMFWFTQGPAALVSLLLNLLLIPRFGAVGAAAAALVSYAFLLCLSLALGRRVFALRFPFVAATRILLSVVVMALTLKAFSFPASLLGLAAMIALGGGVYGISLLALNVEGMRRQTQRVLAMVY